jgi:hypothetical protein
LRLDNADEQRRRTEKADRVAHRSIVARRSYRAELPAGSTTTDQASKRPHRTWASGAAGKRVEREVKCHQRARGPIQQPRGRSIVLHQEIPLPVCRRRALARSLCAAANELRSNLVFVIFQAEPRIEIILQAGSGDREREEGETTHAHGMDHARPPPNGIRVLCSVFFGIQGLEAPGY